jgi:large-conductance mechanosensitive channel
MSFTIGKSKFMWGDLISNVIDFLIIAFIVFLAYRQLSKFKLVEDKTKPEQRKQRQPILNNIICAKYSFDFMIVY